MRATQVACEHLHYVEGNPEYGDEKCAYPAWKICPHWDDHERHATCADGP